MWKRLSVPHWSLLVQNSVCVPSSSTMIGPIGMGILLVVVYVMNCSIELLGSPEKRWMKASLKEWKIVLPFARDISWLRPLMKE